MSDAERGIRILAGEVELVGDLTFPADALGLVVFAHGSGSSRLSPRNRFVAGFLHEVGLGTLLFDLLTEQEEGIDSYNRELRFDIPLLARRLEAVVRWIGKEDLTAGLPIGLFGASTGAAAALIAAAELGDRIDAVVSRGGRPDLAGADVLARVTAPTLLIVGGRDTTVLRLNKEAYARLGGPKHLAVVPRAGHLFEEPGALAQVAELAASWFRDKLVERRRSA